MSMKGITTEEREFVSFLKDKANNRLHVIRDIDRIAFSKDGTMEQIREILLDFRKNGE